MPCVLLMALLAAPWTGLSPADADAYLSGLRVAAPDFASRLVRVAQDAAGTPYAEGPLGEGPGAKYDADPLIDLGRADCVTLVEQAIALAASASYAEATANLQRIRYKDGVIDYESRNHFFITDWMENNRWCVNVTPALGVPLERATRTISRRGFFERVKAPGLGEGTPDREVSVNCVPLSAATEAEARIPSPSIVVFVGHVEWLFALHCGLYIRGADGSGLLYHASSKAGEVVAARLGEYLSENAKRYRGFVVYRVGSPPWAQ